MRASEDWIRDEIDNCPTDDGEWQAKMNSALSELLLARQVIERAGHLIRIQECTHSPSEWVHAVSGLDAALRDYDAAYLRALFDRAKAEAMRSDDALMADVLTAWAHEKVDHDADTARLRDTAAALDALVEAEWMVSHDWGGDRASVMGAARAILARLKQEGLT